MPPRRTPTPRKKAATPTPTPAPATGTTSKKPRAAKSPPRARATRATPARSKPAPVVDPLAELRATEPDPAGVHAYFEALRDAEDDPARLFALAVDEARALDELCARTAPVAEFAGALAAALARVFEGTAEGVEETGLAWSLARAESLLRPASARALDPVSHARALTALARGYTLAGDSARARSTAARAVTPARAAFDADSSRWETYQQALALVWEFAAQARDVEAMAASARARADAEALRPGGADAAAQCEALAPLWQLWAELGDPAKSLLAADEWLAAEERAQTAGLRRAQGGGRLDALRARAAAARAVLESARAREAPAALAQFARAADAWVDGARAAVRDAALRRADADAGHEIGFALARLAESLSAQTEAAAMAGDAESAVARAREWLEAERAVTNGALSEGALAAISALATLVGSLPAGARAGAAEAVLDALAGAGPEADELRAQALADSARAHFALGRHATAAARARAWCDLTAAQVGATESCVMRVLLARSEESAGRVELPAKSTRARKTSAALEAVDLAARARAALRAGDTRAATKRADEALAKLRGARGVPAEVRDYVHYAHEGARIANASTSASSGEKPSGGPECAARAIAALESGDAARAAALLRALRADKLGDDGCTLAHVLTACVEWVARVAPDDPSLADGRAALAALDEYALLSPR